jgi:hypothetical protein
LKKLASLPQIIRFNKDYDLIRVIDVAEEITPFGTDGFAGVSMFIEYRLPLGIFLDFMSDIFPPF